MSLHRLLAAAAAATLGAALLASTPANANPSSTVDWADCQGGFECATVAAPLG